MKNFKYDLMRKKSLGASLLAIGFCCLTTNAAWAAQADQQPGASETGPAGIPANTAELANVTDEIIVTARRREESILNVPIAVTALSAENLSERQIASSIDLQGQIPSLSVNSAGQSRDVQSFTIRGQGATYTAAPAVVQYFAEVPSIAGKAATLQGGPGQFLDLANVQILRGPQGTLFGRNATGGAVLIEPRRPSYEYSGYLEIQAGSHDHRQIEGAVNVPLSSTLAVRAAGQFSDRDGYTRDVVTGTDYDDRHYYAGRLGVLWEPASGVENYLIVSGGKSRTNGTGFILENANIAYIDAVFSSAGGCAGVGLGAGCSVYTDAIAAQRERGPRKTALGPPSIGTRISTWSVIDQLKVDIGPNTIIRNLISFSRLKATLPYDGDGTPLPHFNVLVGQGDNVKQFTEELQIQGTILDGSLDYTVGGYYESVKTPGNNIVTNNVFLSPTGQLQGYATSSRAIYAQANYNLGGVSPGLSGVTVTGGYRYTWDRARGRGVIFAIDPATQAIAGCLNGVAIVPTVPADCVVEARQKSSADNWTVGLDYQATEGVLLYGKYTRGYKAGGPNFGAVNPENALYQPEYVRTTEAGLKIRGDMGGVRWRGALNLFHTKYKDIQLVGPDINFSFNPPVLGNGVFNAASATINGVEFEGLANLGRYVEIGANYSYVDAKFNSYRLNSPFGQQDCSGQYVVGQVDLGCIPFPYSPKHQFSVSGKINFPVDNRIGDVSLFAIYSYISGQFTSKSSVPEFEPGDRVEGYGRLNISIDWRNVYGSQFDVGLFASNLTNETYRIANTGVWGSIGVQSSTYGEPRMWGGRLRYSWK